LTRHSPSSVLRFLSVMIAHRWNSSQTFSSFEKDKKTPVTIVTLFSQFSLFVIFFTRIFFSPGTQPSSSLFEIPRASSIFKSRSAHVPGCLSFHFSPSLFYSARMSPFFVLLRPWVASLPFTFDHHFFLPPRSNGRAPLNHFST